MKWKEIKVFLDNCTEEQLATEAMVAFEDYPMLPIQHIEILEEDLYIDGGDLDSEQILMTKSELLNNCPNISEEDMKIFVKNGSIWAE